MTKTKLMTSEVRKTCKIKFIYEHKVKPCQIIKIVPINDNNYIRLKLKRE